MIAVVAPATPLGEGCGNVVGAFSSSQRLLCEVDVVPPAVRHETMREDAVCSVDGDGSTELLL